MRALQGFLARVTNTATSHGLTRHLQRKVRIVLQGVAVHPIRLLLDGQGIRELAAGLKLAYLR